MFCIPSALIGKTRRFTSRAGATKSSPRVAEHHLFKGTSKSMLHWILASVITLHSTNSSMIDLPSAAAELW